MSEMKNFEEHLRKSFVGYSPEVPSHIWENISAEKKKKRPAAWWLSKNFLVVAIFLLIAFTSSIFFLNKKKDNYSKTMAVKSKVITGCKDNLLVAKQNAGPAATIISEEPQRNTRLTDHKTKLPGVKGQHLATTEKYHTNKANTNYRSVSSQAVTLKHQRKHIQAGTTAVTAGTNKNGIDVKPSAQAFDVAAQTVTGDENKKDLSAQEFLITTLNFSPEKLTASSLADTKKPELKAIQIPGCPANKDAAGDRQYWEIYAGPDYAFKQYSDTANSMLLEKRKASTSFQYAFSAGVRYTRVFNNGMSLRAGLSFSQVNEKFSYVQSNVVQVVYEINTNGDTISSYNVRGTKYKNSFNQYRTIDLPVMVGYELGYGRLHANINAGPVINIYSWQNGETLDTTLQPVSFSNGKSNAAYQYKNNVGVGFMGAVSLYYRLNERFHLLAEPYYRYNFSPMNKEILSIQERFSTIGIRLGLRFNL